jgi:hypothetical protein
MHQAPGSTQFVKSDINIVPALEHAKTSQHSLERQVPIYLEETQPSTSIKSPHIKGQGHKVQHSTPSCSGFLSPVLSELLQWLLIAKNFH